MDEKKHLNMFKGTTDSIIIALSMIYAPLSRNTWLVWVYSKR